MINPGLIVSVAALVVLVQLALTWLICRHSVGKSEKAIMGRIDELNSKVSALTRKVEDESALAMQALDEVRQMQLRG